MEKSRGFKCLAALGINRKEEDSKKERNVKQIKVKSYPKIPVTSAVPVPDYVKLFDQGRWDELDKSLRDGYSKAVDGLQNNVTTEMKQFESHKNGYNARSAASQSAQSSANSASYNARSAASSASQSSQSSSNSKNDSALGDVIESVGCLLTNVIGKSETVKSSSGTKERSTGLIGLLDNTLENVGDIRDGDSDEVTNLPLRMPPTPLPTNTFPSACEVTNLPLRMPPTPLPTNTFPSACEVTNLPLRMPPTPLPSNTFPSACEVTNLPLRMPPTPLPTNTFPSACEVTNLPLRLPPTPLPTNTFPSACEVTNLPLRMPPTPLPRNTFPSACEVTNISPSPQSTFPSTFLISIPPDDSIDMQTESPLHFERTYTVHSDGSLALTSPDDFNECIPVEVVYNTSGSSLSSTTLKKRCDRKHYCMFCDTLQSNFSRHLKRNHKNELPVEQYCSITGKTRDDIKRKTEIFDIIRRKGDFIYNESIINSGNNNASDLLPVHRPKITPNKDKSITDFVQCKTCNGIFSRRSFRKHASTCVEIPTKIDNDFSIFKNKTLYLKNHAKVLHKRNDALDEIWARDIVDTIHKDEIGTVALNDHLLVLTIKDYFRSHLESVVGQHSVTNKLRDGGRLLLSLRKNDPEIKCMEDIFKPSKVDVVMKTVQDLSGYDMVTGNVKIIGMPARLSWLLSECSAAHLDTILTKRNIPTDEIKKIKEEVEEFNLCIKRRWKFHISTNAEKIRKIKKFTKEVVMPDNDDIKLVSKKLNELQSKFYENLLVNVNPTNYEKLCKVCIPNVMLFNRRRPGEVARAELNFFIDRAKNEHLQTNYYLDQFSDEEKQNLDELDMFTVPGKNTLGVPILLTKDMTKSIDLLISCRTTLGISLQNKFLFAKINSYYPFDGSKLLREFKESLGNHLKRPQDMTATGLRHNVATQSFGLNKSLDFRANLAESLGHNIETHNKNYRYPLPIIQKGQVGTVLRTLAGHSSVYDFDENVHDHEHTRTEPTCIENSEVYDIQINKPEFFSLQPKRKKTRQKWTDAEKSVVVKEFEHFIQTQSRPGHASCHSFINQQPLLSTRTAIQVNALVDNILRKKVALPPGFEYLNAFLK